MNTSAFDRRRAFSLVELLVVISIIALLIGILVPALAAVRGNAKKLQNSANLTNLHQASVLFADQNRGWYSGLTSAGTFITSGGTPAEFPDSGSFDYFVGSPLSTGRGLPVRYALLLSGDFIDRESIVSPEDDEAEILAGPGEVLLASAAGGPSYSYSMLNMIQSASPTANELDRYAEWRNTNNPEAIVFSDRNTGANTTTTVSSLWTRTDSGNWEGHVVFNNGTVEYLQDQFADTRYSDGTFSTADNIFDDGVAGSGPGATEMFWQ